MAQDDKQNILEANTIQSESKSPTESYPFVTGMNYTNVEDRDYITTPLGDPTSGTDTDEDVTDEVRAARADVENTWAEMTGTIDALKEKLSPANLVAEAKEATIGAAQTAVSDAVDSAKEVAHNVVDTAKEVAVNAASVVQGVASTVVDTAKDVVISAADAVHGAASNVVASITGVVDSAKSVVSGAAQDAGHAAKNATQSVKDVSHNVGHTAKGVGASIVETIRLNPIPAAITGIGLGWLIMSIRRHNADVTPYGTIGGSSANRFVSTTDEYGQNNFATSGYAPSGANGPSGIDAAKEKLGDVKDSVTQHVGDIAANVSDKASDIASSVSDKASDIASTVGEKATAFGEQAKDTAQSAVSATGTYINDNPLAAGAIALLIGVGVGLLVPATAKENQLLGETRDRLKDQAAEQLHQVADKVSNIAHTAFDSAKQTVKDEAQNQGLTGSPA